MTSVQAAFDILCLLSLCDGTNAHELRVIQDFLDRAGVGNDEIHAARELEALGAMSAGEVLVRFREAVAVFKERAPRDHWGPLVEFATKVALADRVTSNIEVVGVGYLAKELGVEPTWE